MDLDDENINSAKVERIVKATSALVVSSTHADFEDINEQEAAPVCSCPLCVARLYWINYKCY